MADTSNLIPMSEDEAPLSRPDSIALDLAGDLANSASLCKAAIAEGKYNEGYSHIQACAESISELMKGYQFMSSVPKLAGIELSFEPNKLERAYNTEDVDADPCYQVHKEAEDEESQY